jgi:AcrR family transcriptional regulator
LATAERLFYRDGFRVVGIDTLLAEAGVAKMTLYNHFASKDDLISAVLVKRDRWFRDSLTTAVSEAGRSPLKQLQAVFDWHERWFGGSDFNGCAFLRALSEYPDPDHPINKTAWSHKEGIKALLATICQAAEAKNPVTLASTLNMLLDGAIVAAHATRATTSAVDAKAAATVLLKNATA